MGFAGGVNAGLKEVNTEYVILLNNDTEVFPDYIEELVKAIKKSKKIFFRESDDDSIHESGFDG